MLGIALFVTVMIYFRLIRDFYIKIIQDVHYGMDVWATACTCKKYIKRESCNLYICAKAKC